MSNLSMYSIQTYPIADTYLKTPPSQTTNTKINLNQSNLKTDNPISISKMIAIIVVIGLKPKKLKF